LCSDALAVDLKTGKNTFKSKYHEREQESREAFPLFFGSWLSDFWQCVFSKEHEKKSSNLTLSLYSLWRKKTIFQSKATLALGKALV
jgi:hypothetical protein